VWVGAINQANKEYKKRNNQPSIFHRHRFSTWWNNKTISSLSNRYSLHSSVEYLLQSFFYRRQLGRCLLKNCWFLKSTSTWKFTIQRSLKHCVDSIVGAKRISYRVCWKLQIGLKSQVGRLNLSFIDLLMRSTCSRMWRNQISRCSWTLDLYILIICASHSSITILAHYAKYWELTRLRYSRAILISCRRNTYMLLKTWTLE
jgi:hypothetical protein